MQFCFHVLYALLVVLQAVLLMFLLKHIALLSVVHISLHPKFLNSKLLQRLLFRCQTHHFCILYGLQLLSQPVNLVKQLVFNTNTMLVQLRLYLLVLVFKRTDFILPLNEFLFELTVLFLRFLLFVYLFNHFVELNVD